MILRPYQDQAVKGLRQSVRVIREAAGGNVGARVLLYAPTGSGKTIMATEVLRSAVEKGSTALFVAHRRELVHQASDKLSRFGLPHGIILAGEEGSPMDRVQVASIQTLHARAIRRDRMDLPPADVIVLDEAHHAVSKTWVELVSAYPDAVVIGLTATPVRSDGKGLGHIFGDMVRAPSIHDLTAEGFLVPVRYFAPSMPDLWGVKVRAGDYVQGDLGRVMDKPKLVGDVVSNWGRICPDRKTVVYASTVKHSLHLRDQFLSEGVRAAHIDGTTPTPERDRILRDLEHGRIQVVCNCMVLTEGWDCPSASCAVLARPTKSLGLYLQMAGRILRPAGGKSDAVLIDHSGAVYEHGFITSDFEWSLDPEARIQEREVKRKEREPSPITCKGCSTVYTGQLACPACGMVPEKRGKYLSTAEGELGEVKGKPKARKVYSMEEKREWFAMLTFHQREKGYAPGWVSHSYKAKFGVWPQGVRDEHPIPPSVEVSRWIKHRAIRRAKARERNAAA